MEATVILVLCLLLNGAWAKSELKFPGDFKFGAATSSYQIEGGWNASDKTPNTWDVFTQSNPEVIVDLSNGNIACDSYNRWQDDIQIASDLGLDFYRFSISWARILPNGTPDYISEDGVRYYNNLINGLLEKGIEPVVTMYHWDLPQRFQNLGGWANPLIVDWFGDYAKVLYKSFGDRVKTWITINEAIAVCTIPYSMEIFPPKYVDYDIGFFHCAKNLMMAHATAYRIYDEEFRTKFQGRVGLTNQQLNFIPATKDDEEVTDLTTQLYTGIYSHPIYSKMGGWPPSVVKVIKENSLTKGWSRSRLPAFTDEEREFVKGTADFYGLNFYTSRVVTKAKEEEIFTDVNIFLNIPEIRVLLDVDPAWKKGASFWFYIHPEGLRSQLNWVKKSFGDVNIIIYENGLPTLGNNLHDTDRINYYKDHLEQVLLAIYEDGVNVSGYTAWTLIDNFEWMEGYTTKFGLYEVDFSSSHRTRTPRDSAHYYKKIISTRSIIHTPNYIKNEL